MDRGIATGDDQTSFTNEQNLGGDNIHATQNYQFDSVIPDLHTFTPSTNTKLTSQIRTVTGTSAGGNEVSFIDKGFEPVVVYESNRLDSPRIVCSRRNEISKLPNLPKRRSFTLAFRLETTDPTPGSGVLSEVITTGAVTQLITPGAICFNSSPTATTYAKVVNKSGSTANVTVTLTYLRIEN